MNNHNGQALVPNTKISSKKNLYTIKKVLGTGSFGITYLAIGSIKIGNVSFEVPFAIKEHFIQSCYREKNGSKVLYTPSSKNEVELSRKDFLTEARRLQQLCTKTKYIVKVNETFEANGTAYYVMEYLSGGVIHATSKQQAIDYMLSLSEAVKVLHDNKVLHMDIKPSNIILKVDEDTGETYPVLIDFGITKHFDDKGRPTTAPHSKGASTGFAPIEQYDEVREFSPAIDIYAMGATLYYLLTRKNPPSASKLCYNFNIVRDTLKSAHCEEFIPFITKAMAPNRMDRFCTAYDMEEALRCVKLRHYDPLTGNNTYNEQITTDPHFLPLYTFKKNPLFIDNQLVINRLHTIIIAQNTSTKLFGIIDTQNKVVVPFEYLAIGCFEELLDNVGKNFIFGERILVAPFFKFWDNKSYQGGLVIEEDGRIVETTWHYHFQAYFPTEPRTLEVVHKHTFFVDGKQQTIYIQRVPWGHYGISDSEGHVIAPFIYDSIDPFSEKRSQSTFLGSKYTIGNHIGYFRIDWSGILFDYARYNRDI